MMGKLGFDIVVSKLSPQDLKFVQTAVSNYNAVKDVIWGGDQFRLSNPADNSVASVLYVDEGKSRGVMFNYLVNYRYGAGSLLPIRLKGLDPARNYRVSETNLYPGTSSTLEAGKVYSGDFLMKVGINPDVHAGRASVVLMVEEAR